MSPLGESVQFDDPSRASASASNDAGVLQSIRDAAVQSGLDPAAELYNEALSLATEGHYRMAQDRLHVLLGIAPSDGDARLLLAKIHVAGQQWRRALATLDEAAQCGVTVPEDLRLAVERHLQADDESFEEQRSSSLAREQGEMKRLRSETRRLRSENAALISRTYALESEAKRWAWMAAATSTVAIVFMVGRMLFSGPEAPVELDVEPGADLALTEGTPRFIEPTIPTATSAGNAALANQAAEALSGSGDLFGAEIAVEVQGDKARLVGKVPSYAALRSAERLVGRVDGIGDVDAGTVIVTSRVRGTEHVVRSGDTLSGIAWRYYGESNLYPHIVKANRMTGAADLQVGQKLVVPAMTTN